MTTPTTPPICRWAGGKTKLLPQILRYFPNQIDCYRELFVGGGSVFFALQERSRIYRSVLMDSNGSLMGLYARVLCYPEGLHEALERLVDRTAVTEKRYLSVRSAYNDINSDVDTRAAFLFLNKTCFNGLYRVNKAGNFNVPWGKITEPSLPSLQHLRAVQHAFQQAKTSLQLGNAIVALDECAPGDYVYLDPPYDTEKGGFTDYTNAWNGRRSQAVLAVACSRAAKRGVRILLSNADTSFVRNLFDPRNFSLEEVTAARSINSKGTGRGKVKELLISANMEPTS